MLEKILDRFPFLTKLSLVQWLIAFMVAGFLLGRVPPIAQAWFDENYERNANPRRTKVYAEITVIKNDIHTIKSDTRDIKNILMSRE